MSDQDLWRATTLLGVCRLTATQESVDRGLVAPTWRLGTPALVEGTTLAYPAKLQPVTAGVEAASEFGAYAHGPEAQVLTARLVERIRVWTGR